jgi:FKBP-type peptidyl-prolyl cis-trans isomerase SlyD
MKIEQNRVVSLSYRLEANGNEIEVVAKENPMQFMYGAGYLLPTFEDKIANMSVGDKFDFILQAVDAYGEINEDAIMEIPKNAFEVEGKFDDEYIVIGANIPMQDQEGNRLYGIVEKIEDYAVTMNFNHPLAGNELHFTGEIVDIREATPEDLLGNCSCDCCSQDDCCDNCYDDDCSCD